MNEMLRWFKYVKFAEKSGCRIEIRFTPKGVALDSFELTVYDYDTQNNLSRFISMTDIAYFQGEDIIEKNITDMIAEVKA